MAIVMTDSWHVVIQWTMGQQPNTTMYALLMTNTYVHIPFPVTIKRIRIQG